MESNLEYIVTSHARIHTDSNVTCNSDFSDSFGFRGFVESELDFKSKKMIIQIVVNLDGFPASKRYTSVCYLAIQGLIYRYSITPVLMQIADLPAHKRGLAENIVLFGVFGARQKISLTLWEEYLMIMKKSIESAEFDVAGWRYARYFEIML